MREAVELLDAAVEVARSRGHEVSGWTLQSDPEGYAAWLHNDDEIAGQVSLFRRVELVPTMEQAAQLAVALASELPTRSQEASA